MLYELESAPFAQKPSTITTNKLKTLPGNPSCSTSSSSSCSTQVNKKEQTFVTIKPNGITSDRVYGPELPASMNGMVNGNGKNESSSSSSSESETEPTSPVVKSGGTERLLPAPSMPLISKISEKTPTRDGRKSPPILKPQYRPLPAKTTAPVLVPYEMDDSSNCSDESTTSEARITPKATMGEWKVTTFIPTAAQPQQPPEEGKSCWERKKSESSAAAAAVGELLRLSHTGYGAPVPSWNGTRAQLDKEVNNERREERKRALSDSGEQQGRAKLPKLNNSHPVVYKSNPGYNPIQVIEKC